mgnify:CR=1 FL=1
MKLLIALIVVGTLAGCTTAMKVDNKIGETLKQMDKNMTTDCRAGFAEGLTSGSNLDTALKASLAAIVLYANKDSEEYKRCFTDGAWVSFSVHGSGDLIKKAVTEIGTIGVVK